MPNGRKQDDGKRVILAAEIAPDSFDLEKRTVDVVWYTGASVDRYSWRTGKTYKLRFDMSHDAPDLSILNKNAPVLLDHRMSSHALFGKVVPSSARIENGRGVATVQFTRREEMQGFVQDVADKILVNLSMGVDLLEQVHTEKEDGPDEVLCTSWRPYEISFLPVAADMDTDTLSRETQPAATPNEDNPMPNKNTPAGAPAFASTPEFEALVAERVAAEVGPAVATAVAEQTTLAAGRRVERVAALQIATLALALPAGDHDVARLKADDALDADEARSQLLSIVATRSDANPTHSQRRPEGDGDHLSAAKAGFRDALMYRAQPAAGLKSKAKLTDAGRHFMGRGRMVSMCREFLKQAGDKAADLSDSQIIKIALRSDEGLCREHLSMATGDLPNLLADVMHNSLQRAYEETPSDWKTFCRRGDVKDLRTHFSTKLGDAPDLDVIAEGGPYTHGSFGDDREPIRVVKRGKILSFTEEMMIDDDLDGLGKFPAAFGRAAARAEADAVYSLVTSNPNMNDGQPVFSAARRNLIAAGSGQAPTSAANLNTLIKLMRKQRTLSSKPYRVTAFGILIPEDLRLQVMQTIGDIVPNTGANLTPGEFKRLVMVSDTRLDDADNAAGDDPAVRWFTFGDPAVHDTIRWAYLSGFEGLQTSKRLGFDVDGVDLKAKLYFGAGWMDHRAFAMNAGK